MLVQGGKREKWEAWKRRRGCAGELELGRFEPAVCFGSLVWRVWLVVVGMQHEAVLQPRIPGSRRDVRW